MHIINDNFFDRVEMAGVPGQEPELNQYHLELNALQYTLNGLPVSKYQPAAECKWSRLPYLHVSVCLGLNRRVQVYALYDSGCTCGLLSSEFVKVFPESLKKYIKPVNMQLGTATNAKAPITGTLTLMLALRNSPRDKYPLYMTHDFFIAEGLDKPMFLGSDLIMNENAIVSTATEGVTLLIPPNYPFPTNPDEINGIKFFPFYFLSMPESIAKNRQIIFLEPFESASLACPLSHDLRGQEVIVKNYPFYFQFATCGIEPDHMPRVYEQTLMVNNENCINLTVTNMDTYPLSIPVDTMIAVITPTSAVIPPAAQTIDNNFSTSHEINTLQQAATFYDFSPSYLQCQNENLEANWMHFADNHPMLENMPRSIPFQKQPVNKSKKSDFTQKEFLDMFNFDTLEQNVVHRLKTIFVQHRQAFSHFPMDIRKCNSYTHDIKIIGQPTLPRQRPIQDKVREKVADIVEGLIQAKVMSRGEPRKHYSNFVPIIKPDNSIRLCCDLIQINKHIQSSDKIIQMGSPAQLLHRIFDKPHMWSFDLQNAYFHIGITENCKKYYGMYSYKPFQDSLGFERVIQGEKTSIFSYNAMTNKIFGNFHAFLLFWVDDGLIFNNSIDALVDNTRSVVEAADRNGLSIAPQKFNFNARFIKFLGKEIDKQKGAVQIPEQKLQGLKSLKPPVSYSSLRSFMGVLKYYNSHIPGVGVAAQPLHMLLRQQTRKAFTWTSIHQQAFVNILTAIAESVILYFPYKNGIFEVWTDASQYTYAMHLYSKPRPPLVGEPRLIAMYSSTFKESAMNWHIYMKEFWAVAYAINHWIEHLYGAEIEVYTDCQGLIYCSQAKSDHVVTYRLAMQLSGLNLSFHHTVGSKNKADYTSREWQPFIENVPVIPKARKRSQQEIADLVEQIPVQNHYSNEEVTTLLTYNFSTPVSEQRLQCYKDKFDHLMKDLKYDKRTISLDCCPKCKIEISQLETFVNQRNFPLSYEKLSSNNQCNLCKIPLDHAKELNSMNAFISNMPETFVDKNRKMGREYLSLISNSNIPVSFYSNGQPYFDFVDSNLSESNAFMTSHHVYSFLNERNKNRSIAPMSRDTHFLPDCDLTLLEKYAHYLTMPFISINYEEENCEFLFTCNSANCNHSYFDQPMEVNLTASFYDEYRTSVSTSLEFETDKTLSANLTDPTPLPAVGSDVIIPFRDRMLAKVFKYGTITIPMFAKYQADDKELAPIIESLKTNVPPSRLKNYKLIKGLLFFARPTPLDKLRQETGYKLYIPSELIPFILHREHAPPHSMHVPAQNMLGNMQEKYFFQYMQNIVNKYHKSCRICAYIVPDTARRQIVGNTRDIQGPLKHIVMDYAVAMPVTREGYQHLILIMCAFTRYSMVIPVRTRSSPELLRMFLKTWLLAFQYPMYITADNEKTFHQGAFSEHCQKMGVEFKPLIPYNPKSAGKIENCVHRAKKALTSFSVAMGSRQNWMDFLPMINMGLNNFYHSSIKQSPFHALFCFDNQNPTLDILKFDANDKNNTSPEHYLIRRINREILDKYIVFQDKKRIDRQNKSLNKNTVNRPFHRGEKVMVKKQFHRSAPGVNIAMTGSWVGPFTIIKVLIATLVLIDDTSPFLETVGDIPLTEDTVPREFWKVEHKNHCKPITPSEQSLQMPKSAMDDLDSLQKKSHTMKTRSKNEKFSIENDN